MKTIHCSLLLPLKFEMKFFGKAWRTLGWVYYKLGLYEDSRKYLEQAEMLDKDNETILEHIQMLDKAGR